ncbi:MAG: TraB/GumN family protein [Crocinitomicaceae bacterium]|nr:TraB/GumN family protein [Crocinitomicaceae bacterium]
MSKKIGFFGALLCCTIGFGQYLDEFPTKVNSLLWKIEGKDVKKDAYLFGTIHIIDKDKFYFPKELKKIVSSSKQVVLEIANINQAEAMKYVILEKGTLFDFFTPEQKDSIFSWAKSELKMEPNQFKMSYERMKPFVLIQVASQKALIGKTESYDLTIQHLANENKIPSVGLETIAEQMAIFDKMDTIKQRNMVMDFICNPHKQDSLMVNMFDIYLKQNVDAMYQYMQDDGGSLMDAQEDLLDKRNRNWIPKIEALIKEKKTFIGVGAGHLGGENGVLRLLEKKGYRLTPVYF